MMLLLANIFRGKRLQLFLKLVPIRLACSYASCQCRASFSDRLSERTPCILPECEALAHGALAGYLSIGAQRVADRNKILASRQVRRKEKIFQIRGVGHEEELTENSYNPHRKFASTT
jgi:hypothetical protein